MKLTSENFNNEINTANKAAMQYFSNYHAWNYRHFILNTWMNSQQVPKEFKEEIITSEKLQSDAWISAHVSDYCGYHYRHKIFDYILITKKFDDFKLVFMNELQENKNMILFYPGHESLWYHRRYIFNAILNFLQTKSLKINEDCDLNILFETEHELVRLVSMQVIGENIDRKEDKNSISATANSSLLLNNKYSLRYSHWLFNLKKKYIFC